MSATETAAATAPTEQVKAAVAPAPEAVVPKDPVVRTLTAAIRRVLTHTKPSQETPKEEAKAEVCSFSPFFLADVSRPVTIGGVCCSRC